MEKESGTFERVKLGHDEVVEKKEKETELLRMIKMGW